MKQRLGGPENTLGRIPPWLGMVQPLSLVCGHSLAQKPFPQQPAATHGCPGRDFESHFGLQNHKQRACSDLCKPPLKRFEVLMLWAVAVAVLLILGLAEHLFIHVGCVLVNL